MEREKLFGFPVWLALVVLGGAGLVGYLIFIRGSSSTSASQQNAGTTGYSSQGLAVMQNPDESATMALQNQELSVLSEQLGGVNTTLSNMTDQMTTGFGTVGSTLSGQQQELTNLSGQVSGLSGALSSDTSALGSQLGSLQNSQNASASANQAYYNSLLTNLINYSNSLSSQVQAGDSNAAAQQQQTQGLINQMGNFLGWQFYQIPNRYQATIPSGLNPPGFS